MTTLQTSAALRICALVGLFFWGLAALYVLIVVMAGFANLGAPNFYFTALVIIGAFFVNFVLFRRAQLQATRLVSGLALLSVLLSVLVVGIFTYVALDLGS